MSEFAISRRELYILPTRMGWYFALIMVALFGIAIKFDNQAAFMMLFVLISIALIGMIYTHNNMIGLKMNGQSSNPVFLGEQAEFPVLVKNPSNKLRHAVWIISGGFNKVMRLPTHDAQLVQVKLPTVQRGYLNCAPISLTSMFPIGVFFCWTKRYTPDQRCLVYPQPLNLIPLPTDSSQSGKHEKNSAAQQGNEDFSGMKQYQEGDRIRDIHWPSVAKTNKLVTIEYETLSPSSVNLSWQNLPSTMSVEDKLSQLCYWVVEAENSSARYQLDMPNHTISYDKGPNHYHACLRTLALWGLDSDTIDGRDSSKPNERFEKKRQEVKKRYLSAKSSSSASKKQRAKETTRAANQ